MKKKKKKYWYYFSWSECVLCGKNQNYKERRYTKKPKNTQERNEFLQFTCGSHFL